MPQELEAARRAWEAGRRAWEEFVVADPTQWTGEVPEHWDPEVVYEEDPKWPGAGAVRGATAVQRRFREYLEVLGDEIAAALDEVVAGTDGMVALVTVGGRTTGSGVPYQHRWAYHFRMRDGRVTWFRAYFDPGEALAAAGVER
jgi:ketosteroid isomerase-like protein